MTAPNVPSAPTCYRHPGRVAYLRCARCDRHICGDCMRSAPVGQQCADCVRAGARQARTARPVRPGMPAVSYGLIALNVLAFVVANGPAGAEGNLVLRPAAVADGQLYRLVTSTFLHYGLVHLLVNMWALYVVGPVLETLLGRWRFGALYGLSALGGSVAAYLWAPLNTATAGASGAVFGLFGAVFVVARRLRLDVRWVGTVIVINLIFTFSVPHISWQSHVGGLVTGTLVALAYLDAPRQRRTLVQIVTTLAALVVLAVVIWWRTAELAGVPI